MLGIHRRKGTKYNVVTKLSSHLERAVTDPPPRPRDIVNHVIDLVWLALRALTDCRIIFESSRRFIGNGFSWIPSRARKRAKNRKKNLGHNKTGSANVIHVNLFFPSKFDKSSF